MIRHHRPLFVSIFLLMTCVFGFAQGAQLQGRVADSTGAVINRASVRVVDQLTGAERSTDTNDKGQYTVPGLNPSLYKVFVHADGFSLAVSSPITLNVAQTAALDFTMQVGSGAEQVIVGANNTEINTTDASVSTVIGRELIDNLPLNGRSFQQLITLAPGVNLVNSQNYGDLGEFSVNGQRPTQNYFTVDGVSANQGTNSGAGLPGLGETLSAAGGTGTMVSVDALQEFRILTSSFAPEYGRTPGGQVILQTRSGSSQFHGSLFEYFRNDVLDGNDWFANRAGAERAALRFNNFGGTLGGPILKSNTFFFFSYEGQELRQPQFGLTSLPDETTREASVPAVRALLDTFPVPNGPELGAGFAQFSGGYSNPISTKAASLRLDHAFGTKLAAFGRYSYAPSNSIARGATMGFTLQDSYLAQQGTLGLTYAPTAAMTDELRASWGQNPLHQFGVLDSFGGAVPTPTIFSGLDPLQTTAYVWLAGSIYNIAGPRLEMSTRQANLTDTYSYSKGVHDLKFGIDYLRSLPILWGGYNIKYFFTTTQDAIDNNFYCGCKSAVNVFADATNLSLFAQDTWHVSHRLTATYGLRWDINPPPHSRANNNGNYLPLLGDYSSGDVHFGKPGSSIWDTQYGNFAPRIGVAYQVANAPGKELVVRGGFGLFYDPGTTTAAADGFGGSYPSFQYQQPTNLSLPVAASILRGPPIDLANPPAGTVFSVYPANFASPRVFQWNVTVQQGLGLAQSIILSYVGASGNNLLYQQYYPNVTTQAYGVSYTDNSGSSVFNSFQAQLQRKLVHGLSGILTYSWSHSTDDSSTDDYISLPPGVLISPRINWGPSDFDIRNSFRAAFSWNVPTPFESSFAKAITGGWGLDGIVTFRSATPVDIGSYNVNVFGGNYYIRPDVVPGQSYYLYGSDFPGGRGFNPAAFTPTTGVQGDLARNTLRGFNLSETDLSARRSFHLTERTNLLLRGDFFNLFNHPNFGDPDSATNDPTFGKSLQMANGTLGGDVSASQNSAFQTGGPRTIQFSLKLQF